MRKGEIACNKQFLLFSQCFLPYMKLIFHFKCTLKCCLQFVSIWASLKFCHLVIWVNSFPNNSWFLRVCSTSLLKTLWEKEKLFITSKFSFSHSVFYPFGEPFAIFIKVEIVVCNFFQFGRV